jgi:hypothetical protein
VQRTAQGQPIDVLHDDGLLFGVAIDGKDLDESRVAQRRGQACLIDQVVRARAVDLRLETLDGDDALQLGIPGFVDLPEAALA